MATTMPSLYLRNRLRRKWSSATVRRSGAIFVLMYAVCAAHAETPAPPPPPPTVELRIRNHLFEPSEIHVPAHTKVRLLVQNLDSTLEEFKSWDLNRKKIIFGERSATLFIGPLAPGTYPFFGEFNPKTALGKLIAK
ncbi:MAG: cupredoxin domain-containing protein [Gammaproteobacteria bacterium]